MVLKLQLLGHIKFGLDTISNKDTFQKLYDATAGTPEVFLDSLLLLDGKSIKTDPARNVHWGYTLGYLVVQKEKSWGPKSWYKHQNWSMTLMLGGKMSCLQLSTKSSMPI